MSTLTVVEEILRTVARPMTVRQIVERAGAKLPSRSKTPDTVVARDLAMDLKRHGEASKFARTAPGLYTLRALVGDGGQIVSASTPTNGARVGTLAARTVAADVARDKKAHG